MKQILSLFICQEGFGIFYKRGKKSPHSFMTHWLPLVCRWRTLLRSRWSLRSVTCSRLKTLRWFRSSSTVLATSWRWPTMKRKLSLTSLKSVEVRSLFVYFHSGHNTVTVIVTFFLNFFSHRLRKGGATPEPWKWRHLQISLWNYWSVLLIWWCELYLWS